MNPLRTTTMTLTLPAALSLDALADALSAPGLPVGRGGALVAALGVAHDLIAAGSWGDHWPRREAVPAVAVAVAKRGRRDRLGGSLCQMVAEMRQSPPG